MKSTTALVLALWVLSASPAKPADLEIGQVRLHLGMPLDQVLDVLSREFEPKQVSVTEGKYLLWRRNPPHGLIQSAGSVSFRDGKLYRASKTWGETPTLIGTRDAIDGLFAALSEVAGKAGRVGRVRAETLRAPGAEGITGSVVRLVTVELPPDRTVVVQITEPLTTPGGVSFERSASVDEFLMELPKSH